MNYLLCLNIINDKDNSMKGRGYMLINEKIEIVLNHRNHNYYHEMGYVFNDDDWKNNKTILVDQSHIMKGI